MWGAFSVTGAVWQWESRESLGSVCGPAHGFSSEAPNGDTSDNEEISWTHKDPSSGSRRGGKGELSVKLPPFSSLK